MTHLRLIFHLLIFVPLAAAALGCVAGFFAWVEGQSSMIWEPVGDSGVSAWQMIALPMAIGVLGLLRQRLFVGTEGTGIPQTIAVLDQDFDNRYRRQLLSWRVALGKSLLTAGGLLSGASLGREGPTVQIGACLMERIANRKWLPDWLRERGVLLAGGAAGIAASFNAPVAGLVFACEEIGRRFDKRQMPVQVFTVTIACIVALLLGSRFYFYGNHSIPFGGLWEWIGIILLAPIAGLFGGLFALALRIVVPRLMRVIKRNPFMVCFLLGSVLSVIALISNGQSLGSGYSQARMMIEGEASYGFGYFLSRMGATFVTLCSGIPGGLFDPTLSAGAGLGSGFGAWWSVEYLHAFVLIGMAAYFAGVVQSPMTSAIILIEMTGAINLTLPLFLATMLAYCASRLVCRVSLYESLAQGVIALSQKKDQQPSDRPD